MNPGILSAVGSFVGGLAALGTGLVIWWQLGVMQDSNLQALERIKFVGQFVGDEYKDLLIVQVSGESVVLSAGHLKVRFEDSSGEELDVGTIYLPLLTALDLNAGRTTYRISDALSTICSIVERGDLCSLDRLFVEFEYEVPGIERPRLIEILR